MPKCICIIDGQGGGIGAAVIKKIRENLGETVEIIALGTNALATSQMLKAGANKGASGENSICRTVNSADFIIGPIAITWANAMLGELTSPMAEAITSCKAFKILLTVFQEEIELTGLKGEPLPHLINEAVNKVEEIIDHV